MAGDFVRWQNHSGVATDETFFSYRVEGDLVTAPYAGGPIKVGQVLGRVIDSETITLRFQTMNEIAVLRH